MIDEKKQTIIIYLWFVGKNMRLKEGMAGFYECLYDLLLLFMKCSLTFCAKIHFRIFTKKNSPGLGELNLSETLHQSINLHDIL